MKPSLALRSTPQTTSKANSPGPFLIDLDHLWMAETMRSWEFGVPWMIIIPIWEDFVVNKEEAMTGATTVTEAGGPTMSGGTDG